MLSNEKKIEHLDLMMSNIEKRRFELSLEMRLLERKKLLGREGDLATISNLITAAKSEDRGYIEKMELLEEELANLTKK